MPQEKEARKVISTKKVIITITEYKNGEIEFDLSSEKAKGFEIVGILNYATKKMIDFTEKQF